jgi:hypothetical protein
MIDTIIVHSAVYAASSSELPMRDGGNISETRYSAGSVDVRT